MIRRTMLIPAAALTIAVAGSSGAWAVPAAAAVKVDLTAAESAVVEADQVRLYASVQPVRPEVMLTLQTRTVATAPWTTVLRVRTHVSGRTALSTRAVDPGGAMSLRVLATVPGSTPATASGTAVVRVSHPRTYHGDRTGPDLIALRYRFCVAVADSFKVLTPAQSPAYGALVAFAGSSYKAAECEGRSFAQSIWAGLSDGLWTYLSGRTLSAAANAAWGPVLDRLLSVVRADAIGLSSTAKNLFNSWVLQNVSRIMAESRRCFATHKFPAWECSWVPAVSALNRQQIR